MSVLRVLPMGSRRRRRGYIEELPSGSFRAVVYVGIDPLTGRLRYLRETAPSHDAAEVALSKLHQQVDENRHPKSAITMAQALEQWLDVADLEETTRDRYEDLIRLYILPRLGAKQAGAVDAELLERFYARLQRCRDLCSGRPPKGHVCRPLATSTTRKIHYIIRGALDRAVRWRYLSVNVAAMAEAPTPNKAKPDPPSAAEAAALLNDAWTDPAWGLMLWLTMVTGCRRGELCALRWRTIEESFAASKELAALDEHQVRTWTSWQRWTALAILAHAFLSVMAATEPAPEHNTGLIQLTRNEIRRLLTAAIAPVHHIEHVIRWSTWRRQHQARARISHYARRAALD
jgi:hypothetical protein